MQKYNLLKVTIGCYRPVVSLRGPRAACGSQRVILQLSNRFAAHLLLITSIRLDYVFN
jgi:hypothetical protein